MTFLTILRSIDTIIATSAIVRYVLLVILSLLLITVVVLKVVNFKQNVDLQLTKSAYVKVSAEVFLQNEKIKELGEQAESQKKNMQQAVNRAAALAVENKKTLGELMKIKLSGSCEEKVRQVADALRK